jgi:hypothetical protein
MCFLVCGFALEVDAGQFAFIESRAGSIEDVDVGDQDSVCVAEVDVPVSGIVLAPRRRMSRWRRIRQVFRRDHVSRKRFSYPFE